MSITLLLAQAPAELVEVPSRAAAVLQQTQEAMKGMPAGGLRWVLIISIVSLVGILWLVHRQHKLARNQVKIAGMLEDMAKRGAADADCSPGRTD